MIHRLLCRLGFHVWGEWDYDGFIVDMRGEDCVVCGKHRRFKVKSHGPVAADTSLISDMLIANLTQARNVVGELRVGPEFEVPAIKWTEDMLR